MQIFAIVVSLAISVVAIGFTVVAVRKMLGVLRQGTSVVGRTGNPVGRTLTMFKETVVHTRMLQWTWVGILHWFAFAAFIVLSTAVMGAFPQLFDAHAALPIIGHWPLYTWVAEFLGLLGTIAIIPLIVYRIRNRPSAKGRGSRFFGSTMWQAYFVEAMVLLESSAILFIRGAEYNLINAEHPGDATGSEFPISQFFGNLWPTGVESVGTLENIIYTIAMLKIVSAMIWLLMISNNLTMGVAWHRFTAWVNIWFKREDDGSTALGAIRPMMVKGEPFTLEMLENMDDDDDEELVLGVGKIEDFSWKGILDFTSCTECGRCQSQCPAWNTEKPLSPKLLMMGLREHAYAKADGTAGERSLIGKTDAEAAVGETTEVIDWFYNPEGGDFVIDEDVLWSCTSCGACVQQCPVDIEHVDHIMDMRRYQMLVESNFPAELNQLFKGLEGKGNPWNMSPNARMDWAKDLDFEVKVVGETIESLDEVDWLFWVGCAGAYEDRAKKTTRAVAELLDIAGISFGVLGNGETCTGDSARRAGNEMLFQQLAAQNVETFKEFKVKKVVSTCAHCFNTLKNEYKDFGIELEVVHHTQLLNRLVREGKLTPVPTGAGAAKRSITYHDPCYLGRHNQEYKAPRELLEILPGAEYVEMERSNEKSFCCGAGGARMWMEETLGSRINVNRTQEAVATGADQIAVGCPFCRVMLADGLTSEQANGKAAEAVEVLDVAQMLLASVKGEQATKLAPGQTSEDATAKPAAKAAAPAAPAAPAETPAAAAPAAAAGSLFDTPAPDDASSLFDTPAPAEPAAPAAGGSLFDEGGSLFDTPAAPAAPVEPAAPAAPAADLGAGSLFDVAPTEPAPAAAAPAPVEPAAPAAPAAAVSGAASVPRTDVDITAVASLFDIEAPEGAVEVAPGTVPTAPTAAPVAAAPAATPAPVAEAPAPVAEAAAAPAEAAPAAPAAAGAPAAAASGNAGSNGLASTPRTDVDITAAASLFDIEAPETVQVAEPVAASAAAPAAAAPVAAPVAAAPAQVVETPAPVAEAPAPVVEAAPVATTPEAAAPVAAASIALPGSNDLASTPRTDVDITAAASLFDIEAPETVKVAEPVAASEASAAPVVEAPAAPAPVAEAAPAPVVEAPVVEAPVVEAPAAPAPVAPVAPAADVKVSGEAHQPRTDVDINSVASLFDL
ncbi:(Fe-S)-binding protein [Nocardioides yefusunii]|uniref:(Fe-S)-binding protein n=1 Tax=Nocardioides yefusunii TaxID=2500546 RepID=A0ABW1QUT9_9ACTN|nr:(Fe-S)-binding protein [Nocardioides yefusunii]